MELLNRIAHSNGGDPQRTIAALRLVNQRLQQELSQLQAQANVELRPEDLVIYFAPMNPEGEQMIWTPKTREAYHDVTKEEPGVYYGAIRERCEYLEKIVACTSSLLRVVIKDCGVACLMPFLSVVVVRLNSIAAFLETSLDSTLNSNESEPYANS
jgi:hypothetical protein